MTDISSIITTKRKQKNLTQKQLGKLLNVSDNIISKWETGKQEPPIDELIKLSKILDISLQEIFNSEENKHNYEKHINKIKKSNKNKILYIIIILLSIISILSIVTVFNVKNNEYTVDKYFYNDKTYEIKSLIINNNYNSMYIIESIDYKNNNQNTRKSIIVNELKLSLFLDDILILEKELEDINEPLNVLLNNINIKTDLLDIKYTKNKDLTLKIEYKTVDDTYKFNFIINK